MDGWEAIHLNGPKTNILLLPPCAAVLTLERHLLSFSTWRGRIYEILLPAPPLFDNLHGYIGSDT